MWSHVYTLSLLLYQLVVLALAACQHLPTLSTSLIPIGISTQIALSFDITMSQPSYCTCKILQAGLTSAHNIIDILNTTFDIIEQPMALHATQQIYIGDMISYLQPRIIINPSRVLYTWQAEVMWVDNINETELLLPDHIMSRVFPVTFELPRRIPMTFLQTQTRSSELVYAIVQRSIITISALTNSVTLDMVIHIQITNETLTVANSNMLVSSFRNNVIDVSPPTLLAGLSSSDQLWHVVVSLTYECQLLPQDGFTLAAILSEVSSDPPIAVDTVYIPINLGLSNNWCNAGSVSIGIHGVQTAYVEGTTFDNIHDPITTMFWPNDQVNIRVELVFDDNINLAIVSTELMLVTINDMQQLDSVPIILYNINGTYNTHPDVNFTSIINPEACDNITTLCFRFNMLVALFAVSPVGSDVAITTTCHISYNDGTRSTQIIYTQDIFGNIKILPAVDQTSGGWQGISYPSLILSLSVFIWSQLLFSQFLKNIIQI